MIIGIGNDIIEKKRVKRACLNKKFLSRIYTATELKLIEKRDIAASNWCVKEAVVKALGTGFIGINQKEIEVLRNDLGRPYVKLYGNALKKAEELNVINIFVTISDTRDYTIAMVVMEGK